MAAYAWFMLIMLIFVAALSYAFLQPSLNKVTDQVNEQVITGDITEQTAVTYKWNLNFFYWIPAIGLIGFAIYAITRAIEVAEAGGRGGGGW
jgi:TRAP-type C4-dicarboxylate transport system permease small subunit